MGFARLPSVPTAQELVDSAFGRAAKASPPKVVPGSRIRSTELARVGTAAKFVESRLNRIVKGFPSVDSLHPFHQELIEALVGVEKLRVALARVHGVRDIVRRLGKDAASRIREDPPPHVQAQLRRALYGRVADLLSDVDEALVTLRDAREKLRRLPDIDPDAPTLVIAGYPNVGKSSFLAAVSASRPEVAPYPFTTKGLVVGHVERKRQRIQLVDTPGLLDRPMDERNAIERQAITALRHLADAVLFLMDVSGHCGYPPESQEHLLAEVRETFADTPVLVVDAKADLAHSGQRPTMSVESGVGVQDTLEAAITLTLQAWEGVKPAAAGG